VECKWIYEITGLNFFQLVITSQLF